jgi:polar amino acid transport system substrate-binding protein
MKRSKGLALFSALLVSGLLSGCATMQSTQPAAGVEHPVLSRIQANNMLVVGTAASMPPFNMTTREGDIIGLEIEMAKFLAASLGVRLDVQPMAFDALIPALEAGKVDLVMSGMTITPERNIRVAFVGPYFISGKAFLTKKRTIAESEPGDIDSPDTTLTALRGSTSEMFVKGAIPKAKFIPAGDYDEAVGMVIGGRVDALVADYPFCVISLLRYPDAGLASIITPFTWEPIGIALPDNDPQFVNLVQNFLMMLKGNGALDEMTEQFFGRGDWLKRLP